MNIQEEAFDKLLAAYPNSYGSSNMRPLWLDTWSGYSSSVIVRTVNHIIRTWHRCPSLDEFMKEATQEIEKQKVVARKEQMATCVKCHFGFVETKPDFFRPCEDCLPEGYEQWRSGKYEPTGL